jgi:methyltransferase (TIGR00027 family)
MGQPSRTAVLVAAGRALGAREPDPHVRNPDYLAERLLGPEEREVLGDLLSAPETDPGPEGGSKYMEVMIARMMIPRTHFIDSRLDAAVREGAKQVVILGAGYDTRAYRFTDMLKDLRVFEVDQPDTQEVKIRRVRDAIGEPPAHLTYVAVDFRSQTIGDALAGAGFRSDLRTFFIWEGVTMYLPAEAVRATLQWIASHSAPGSAVVFDYTYESQIRRIQSIDLDKLPPAAQEAAKRFGRFFAGEPWLSGLPDKAEEEFLNGVGLELRKVMGLNSPEAVEKYLTRADGSIFGTLPATEQQTYLILEAAVPSP